MEVLARRRAEIALASAALRVALKRARTQASNRARQPKRPRQTQAAEAVALALQVADQSGAVSEFWRQKRKEQHTIPSCPPAEGGEPCAAIGIAAPSAAAPDAACPTSAWAEATARTFQRQWLLYQWVAKQNAASGQAPCGPQLWAAWCGLAAGTPDIPSCLRAAPHGLGARGKQWVRRFVRRWRLRRGRPRPGPALPWPELRAKARGEGFFFSKKKREKTKTCFRLWAAKAARNSGPVADTT